MGWAAEVAIALGLVGTAGATPLMCDRCLPGGDAGLLADTGLGGIPIAVTVLLAFAVGWLLRAGLQAGSRGLVATTVAVIALGCMASLGELARSCGRCNVGGHLLLVGGMLATFGGYWTRWRETDAQRRSSSRLPFLPG